ncbi:MAG: hypothetical protein ACYS9X_13345 [Planctomycetota bacterium]
MEGVVTALPDPMPVIVASLQRYEEDLEDGEVFSKELRSPGLLFDLESLRSAEEWTFTIERPSYGPVFGYHVAFVDFVFKGVWAGD